jgi:hypothetical protein
LVIIFPGEGTTAGEGGEAGEAAEAWLIVTEATMPTINMSRLRLMVAAVSFASYMRNFTNSLGEGTDANVVYFVEMSSLYAVAKEEKPSSWNLG